LLVVQRNEDFARSLQHGLLYQAKPKARSQQTITLYMYLDLGVWQVLLFLMKKKGL